MGDASKLDSFEKYIQPLFMFCLQALNDSNALVSEKALDAGTNFINEFGGTRTEIFVQPLIDAILTFEGSNRDDDKSARGRAIALFRNLVERVGEMKRYGQDFLTMDCCAYETRVTILCLLLLSRSDSDPSVRRQCNKLWNEGLQSGAKAKKEIMPYFLACLKDILTNSKLASKRATAEKTI